MNFDSWLVFIFMGGQVVWNILCDRRLARYERYLDVLLKDRWLLAALTDTNRHGDEKEL